MLCKFYYTKLEINVNKNWFEECKTIILYYKKAINYKIVYKNNINKLKTVTFNNNTLNINIS